MSPWSLRKATTVDRGDRAGRPGPGHRSLFNRHLAGLQVRHHLIKRGGGDQAHIGRSWGGSAGLGFQFATRLVQVKLVAAEPQGAAAGAEADRLHAQHADIEVDGLVDVGDGEDQVVDPVDDERCGRRWGAHAATVPASTGGRSTSTPLSNLAPARTSATRCGPLTARQRSWAASSSLKAIASPAALEPGPLVTRVRSRTEAKVDSIGLLVFRCSQCSAGKSKKHSSSSASSVILATALGHLTP